MSKENMFLICCMTAFIATIMIIATSLTVYYKFEANHAQEMAKLGYQQCLVVTPNYTPKQLWKKECDDE